MSNDRPQPNRGAPRAGRSRPAQGQRPGAAPGRGSGRPTRPSPAVYRRRRIVVLVLLLVLVGGITWGVFALKNKFFPGEPGPVPTAEESTGPTEDELANPAECQSANLEASIDLAADSIPVGKTTIPVTYTNIGDIPCLLEVGPETLAMMITSGNDLVWSSAHCDRDLPKQRRLVLAPQTRDTTVFTWSGDRSAKGCPGDQPQAKPGTYRAAVVLTNEVEQVEIERVFGLN